MPQRLKVTIRHVLLLVTVVAILLGGMRWCDTMLLIDPETAKLSVGSVETPVELRMTTKSMPQPPFPRGSIIVSDVSLGGGPQPTEAVGMSQELFTISFGNDFRQRVFCVKVCVHGWFQPDWSKYHLITSQAVEGTTGGSNTVESAFDPATRRLTIRVAQSILSQRWIVSQCEEWQTEVAFIYNGTSFQIDDSPEQRVK